MNEDFTINSEATINTPEDAELQSLAPQMVLCGKYRLEREVGRGGMGVVWKAYDTISERYVALKFVPKEIRHFDKAMEQVRASFRTIQDLNHQNIRPVYGLEKDPGMGYFVVMKWLEGEPLDAVQLTREQKMLVLEKVAAALDYAHEHGVVHRDVKPSNIFLQMNGNVIRDVFLVDFGISAEIQNSMSIHTGAVIHTSGTRAFMPPEQWKGQTQDGRTDQYALAAVAYWLFAGRLPFHVADTQMLRDCVLLDMPDPIAGESPRLNAAIMHGLAKLRQDRFNSCRELVKSMIQGKGTQPSAVSSALSNGFSRWSSILSVWFGTLKEKFSFFNRVKPQPKTEEPFQIPSPSKLPFICYWKYWVLVLPVSHVLALPIAVFCGFLCYSIFLPFNVPKNADIIREISYLIGIIPFSILGLYFSQIFWNYLKTHKFQILYGLPITIIGFVLATQGFVMGLEYIHYNNYFDVRMNEYYTYHGLLYGNIFSLLIFSIKEKWLAPEVWNSPKSWFRLRNLIIGWIIYVILFIFEGFKVGFFSFN